MFENPSYMPTTEIPFSQPSAEVVGADSVLATIEPQVADVPTVAEPVPCPTVWAYVKEIVPANVSNQQDNDYVEFDVILNASCNDKSATLIKKIKFCKHQLIQDILSSEGKPVTVVEEVKDNSHLKRMRELSGIPNSKNWV